MLLVKSLLFIGMLATASRVHDPIIDGAQPITRVGATRHDMFDRSAHNTVRRRALRWATQNCRSAWLIGTVGSAARSQVATVCLTSMCCRVVLSSHVLRNICAP